MTYWRFQATRTTYSHNMKQSRIWSIIFSSTLESSQKGWTPTPWEETQGKQEDDLGEISGYSINTKQVIEKYQKQSSIWSIIFSSTLENTQKWWTQTPWEGKLRRTRSKAKKNNRSKAADEVSYFLQLWKAPEKDEHKRHERWPKRQGK